MINRDKHLGPLIEASPQWRTYLERELRVAKIVCCPELDRRLLDDLDDLQRKSRGHAQ